MITYIEKLMDEMPSTREMNDLFRSIVDYDDNYAIVDSYRVLKLDSRLVVLMVSNICQRSQLKNVELNYKFLYNRDILIWRVATMKKSIMNFEIPYGYREKYYDFIYEVNQLVEEDGIVVLFVNNIPYTLQAMLYVESNNVAAILNVASKHNVSQLEYGKNLMDYTFQMATRGWDFVTLPANLTREKLEHCVAFRFKRQSIAEYEKQGYVIPIDNSKIFISYSHKDKEIVLPFVERLKNLGVQFWIDAVEIDFGDNITEKIQEGMRTCKKAIVFLSHNTKHAFYAKHELTTLFNSIIQNKKKFIPIKLDNVEPDDILFGLNNYLYLDYNSQSDIDKLISKLIFDFRER